MHYHIQDPPAQERNSRRRDTGFPEPLSEDRNTTLPHPDADTSPNATIESTDVIHKHTHIPRSFLHHGGHRSQSSAFTRKNTSGSGLNNAMEYAEGNPEGKGTKNMERCAEKGAELATLTSSDASSSLDGSSEKHDSSRKRRIFKKMGVS
ncbi:uncharacterized protein L3040_005876 [Drepanopeziza brunnea f. sp. 'multigermtubi']|nr:hypothetical protein L3040_005876 [Drepanopeziza brunnea f. sp. 'multigermtubi']